MIKYLIIGLLLAVGAVVRAEDSITSAQAPYDQRGVSITDKISGGEWLFEITNAEPFKVTSVMALNGAGVTNTINLQVVRIHDIMAQSRPDVVTTNILGLVETNYFRQATNLVYSVNTGTVHTATVTGDTLFAISVPFTYINGDFIRITQTDTNEKSYFISGER